MRASTLSVKRNCMEAAVAVLLNIPSLDVTKSRRVKQAAVLSVEGSSSLVRRAPGHPLLGRLLGPSSLSWPIPSSCPLAQAAPLAGKPGLFIFKLAVVSTPGGKRRHKGSFVLGLSFRAWTPGYPCRSLDFLRWRPMPASPERFPNTLKVELVQWNKWTFASQRYLWKIQRPQWVLRILGGMCFRTKLNTGSRPGLDRRTERQAPAGGAAALRVWARLCATRRARAVLPPAASSALRPDGSPPAWNSISHQGRTDFSVAAVSVSVFKLRT